MIKFTHVASSMQQLRETLGDDRFERLMENAEVVQFFGPAASHTESAEPTTGAERMLADAEMVQFFRPTN